MYLPKSAYVYAYAAHTKRERLSVCGYSRACVRAILMKPRVLRDYDN